MRHQILGEVDLVVPPCVAPEGRLLGLLRVRPDLGAEELALRKAAMQMAEVDQNDITVNVHNTIKI